MDPRKPKELLVTAQRTANCEIKEPEPGTRRLARRPRSSITVRRTLDSVSSGRGRSQLLVGLIVIGVGIYQLYATYGARFRDDLKLDRMSEAEERWVTLAGRTGTAARPLAIGVDGAFVVLAAYQSGPSETLQYQLSGSYIPGAMATGLLVARYRRIDPV